MGYATDAACYAMEELLPLRHCPGVQSYGLSHQKIVQTDQVPSSNIAEGWHLGFKSLVQCTNPTLWSFLDALKLEQGLTDQKISDWLMLRAPEPRAKNGSKLTTTRNWRRRWWPTTMIIMRFLNVIAATLKC